MGGGVLFILPVFSVGVHLPTLSEASLKNQYEADLSDPLKVNQNDPDGRGLFVDDSAPYLQVTKAQELFG